MYIARCPICMEATGLVGADVYNLCIVTHSNCLLMKRPVVEAEVFGVPALTFQQIKEAWLLRKFAPDTHMGYLLVSKYGVKNLSLWIQNKGQISDVGVPV